MLMSVPGPARRPTLIMHYARWGRKPFALAPAAIRIAPIEAHGLPERRHFGGIHCIVSSIATPRYRAAGL